MYINKKYRNRRGQALLLLVMLLATVVTVALTAVFKSTTDTQVTKQEEESQKGLAAAEAGIEKALASNYINGTVTIDNIPNFTGSATIDSTTKYPFFVSPMLNSNQQYTYYLASYDPTVSAPTDPFSNYYSGPLNLYFGSQTLCAAVSLEITLVSGPIATPIITRYIADQSNKFHYDTTSASTLTVTTLLTPKTISGVNFNCAVTSSNFPDSTLPNLRLMFVRTFFNQTRIGVCSNSDCTSSPTLPAQGKQIVSNASSLTGNIKKQVVLFQSFPQIPSDFFVTQISGMNGSALPTPTPPSATATPSPTPTPVVSSVDFGVSTHLLWGNVAGYDYQKEVSRLAAQGMKVVRFDFSWNWTQRNGNGTYDSAYITKFIQVIKYIQNNGMQPIVSVIETPPWARASPDLGSFTPPADMNYYGNFMNYLATQTKNNGITNMIYEVWNEPDIINFWPSGINAALYTSMLKTAYTNIKAADPTAMVLGGALGWGNTNFLDQMYTANAKGYFDNFSMHPYASDPGAVNTAIASIDNIRTDLNNHGDSGKSIYLTEFGWQVAPSGGHSVLDDATRASYTIQTVNGILALNDTYLQRGDGGIKATCIFTTAPNATNELSWIIWGPATTPGWELITNTTKTWEDYYHKVQNYVTPTPTPIQPTPTPGDAYLNYEAENGSLVSPIVAGADALASGGKYIYTTTAENGTDAITFTAPTTGNYVVWARILATADTVDSIYVSMDGTGEDIFDMAQGTWGPDWQWTIVNGRGGTGTPLTINPRIFYLTAGSHTLTLRGREANAKVDKVIITNDMAYAPVAPTNTPTPVPPTNTPTPVPPTPTFTPTPVPPTPTRTPTPIPPTNTPTPPPSGTTNMLVNASFDTSSTGISPWILQRTAPGAATVTLDGVNKQDGLYSAMFNVTTPVPATPHYVQLQQRNISVTSKLYTISFYAKSSTSQTVAVVVQNMNTWAELFRKNIVLGTGWQLYTYSFTPSVTVSTPVQLVFNMGYSAGNFWLDKVFFGY